MSFHTESNAASQHLDRISVMGEPLDPARLRAFLISLDEQDSVILDIERNKQQPHVSMPQNRVIGDLFSHIEAYAPGLVRQFEGHGEPSGIPVTTSTGRQ